MNVFTNGSITRKLSALVALALPLALLSAGCTQECYDKYDCKNKVQGGAALTCVANKCVAGDPGGKAPDPEPEPDAGEEADAGTPVPDAGIYKYYARLTSDQEVPVLAIAPPTSDGGSAELVLDKNLTDGGTSLHYAITHTVVAPSNAHFHKAPAGVAGPVSIPLGTVLASPIVGNVTLTPEQTADLEAGHLYINVHGTAATIYAGGEIRGQVLREDWTLYLAVLSGLNEVPPNISTNTGVVGLVFNPDAGTATYSGSWTPGLVASAQHIHAGAPGVAGPPVLDLASADAGSLTETTVDADGGFPYGDGGYYVNVHSQPTYPNGEIRGTLIAK